MKRHWSSVLGLAALAGATLAAQNVQINGAGATFPAPIYTKWFAEYNKLHPDVRMYLEPLGSGAGINENAARTVCYGESDGPMTAEQLQAAPGKILHLPTVSARQVPVFNDQG